jgi:hypothetical protein
MFINAPSSGATHFRSPVFFGVDGFLLSTVECDCKCAYDDDDDEEGFLISTRVMRPSAFCSMNVLLLVDGVAALANFSPPPPPVAVVVP